MKSYYIYLLANKKGGTTYVGVTNNLVRRVREHREDLLDGFSKKHRLHRLVYFEEYQNIDDAISREKQLKKWNRAWKMRLIEAQNPQWFDLYDKLTD